MDHSPYFFDADPTMLTLLSEAGSEVVSVRPMARASLPTAAGFFVECFAEPELVVLEPGIDGVWSILAVTDRSTSFQHIARPSVWSETPRYRRATPGAIHDDIAEAFRTELTRNQRAPRRPDPFDAAMLMIEKGYVVSPRWDPGLLHPEPGDVREWTMRLHELDPNTAAYLQASRFANLRMNRAGRSAASTPPLEWFAAAIGIVDGAKPRSQQTLLDMQALVGRSDDPSRPTGTSGSAKKRDDDFVDAVQPNLLPDDHIDTVLEEADRLLGDAPVASWLRRRAALASLDQERRANRLPPLEPESRHIAITGSPGTGKTTIARLIARLDASTGVREPKLIEIGVESLLRGYTGQTEMQTSAVIEAAAGGTLFIDEAYLLAGSAFGRSALTVLIKAMEDRRHELTVILAGYDQAMRDLTNANEGLKSRIANWIPLPDLDTDQLWIVFTTLATQRQLELDPTVEPAVRTFLQRRQQQPDFGNARDVRNLLDDMIERMAMRLLNDRTNRDRPLLTLADVPHHAPIPKTAARHGYL